MTSKNEMVRVTFEDAKTRPNLDFVLPGLLAGTVGLMPGHGAIGKSMLSAQIGVGVALGRTIAGGLWGAPKPGQTLLLFGEDPPEILQERMYWIREAEQLTHKEVQDLDASMAVRCGIGHDLSILRKTRDGVFTSDFFNDLREMCGGKRLVILDPLSFLAIELDENNNGEMARLMRGLTHISDSTKTAILLLHHCTKPSISGGKDALTNWTVARGASALTNNARWQANLSGATGEECKHYGIDLELQHKWVKLEQVKVNYGPRAEPSWLRRVEGGAFQFVEMRPQSATDKAQREKVKEKKVEATHDKW